MTAVKVNALNQLFTKKRKKKQKSLQDLTN